MLIANELARELGGSMLVPIEHFGGEVSPVVELTLLVSGIIAAGGYSKQAVREYLFEHALVTAREFDQRLSRHEPRLDLARSVNEGRLSARWAQSSDPERMVPVVHRPEEIQIVVAGSANRNRSFIAAQFGNQGLSVSKEIRLPLGWKERFRTSRS
jgi:hypothetical protein